MWLGLAYKKNSPSEIQIRDPCIRMLEETRKLQNEGFCNSIYPYGQIGNSVVSRGRWTMHKRLQAVNLKEENILMT